MFTSKMKPRSALLSASALVMLGFGSHAALAQDVTVKFWMHEHPPRLALDEEIVAAFEAANPGIDIEYEVMPDSDFNTRLASGFAAGAGPDVWNQLSLFVGQAKAAGLLAPIDLEMAGFADRSALEERYTTGLEGITFDGEVFGLPTEVSNFMCFANNDLFEQAGLDADEDFPTTWESVIDVAETLTMRDANGNPTQRGFDFNWATSIYTWLGLNPMITQLGGTMVDEDAYTANLASAESIQVFEYWSNFVNEHKLGGPQYNESRSDFLAGKLAIDCSFGSWGIPQMEDAGIDWSIHPVPRWENAVSDNGNDAYAFYLMANSNSSPEVQAAAWKFAGFYASYALELFEQAGLFTPVDEVVNSDAFRDLEYMPLILEELDKASFSPRIAGFGAVGDLISEGRDRIVLGDENPSDVLPSINDDVNELLAREKSNASSN